MVYGEDLMGIKMTQDTRLSSSLMANELHFEKRKKHALISGLIFAHFLLSNKSELSMPLCDLLGIIA
jgi:hypothetical protein